MNEAERRATRTAASPTRFPGATSASAHVAVVGTYRSRRRVGSGVRAVTDLEIDSEGALFRGGRRYV